MVWLAPYWLLLLPLVMLPWLVYRLARKRRVATPFSAFVWLQAVYQRQQRWQRWRRWLVLSGRALALLLALLALAQPRRSSDDSLATPAGEQPRYLLLFDTSPSMAYKWEGKSLLQVAKEQGIAFVGEQPLTTPLRAVTSKGQWLAEGQAFDRAALRRAIEQLAIEPGEDDMMAAMGRGLQRGEGEESITHVVIFSDRSAHGWPGGVVPQGFAEPLQWVWIDSAQGRLPTAALPSVAIEQVEVRFSATHSEQRLLEVRVVNFGEREVVDVPIHTRLNGELVAQGTVTLPAKSRIDKPFELSLPKVGAHWVQVELLPTPAQDGLLSDNMWQSPLWHSPPLKVMLLNGAPSTIYTQDELFFLERALSVSLGTDGRFEVESRSAQDSPTQIAALQEFDVVMLLNLPSLLPLQRAVLQQFVQQGGGLFWAMGDRVNLAWLNEHMGELLPHALRDRQEVIEAGGIGVGDVPLNELLWQELDEAFVTGLQASRTRRYIHLESGGAGAYRVLLRFADGTPLLVQGVGNAMRERLLLWTTSLDADDSDLPMRPAFVPLMQRLVRYAANQPQQWHQPVGRLGSTLQLHLPRQVVGAFYCESGESCKPASLLGQGRLAEMGPLSRTGLVRIELDDGLGKKEAPELAFATQHTLGESDFTPVVAPLDRQGEQTGQILALPGSGGSEAGEHFSALAFLLMCSVVLLETALLVR